MATIIPNVEIVDSWHKKLCCELDISQCTIEFLIEPDEKDEWVMGRYHPGNNLIQIWIHRSLIGRRITENKKKKIELRILETLLHEYRHHWQYTHAKELVRSSFTVEYYKKPIEIDSRSFAKRTKSRYQKLVRISK